MMEILHVIKSVSNGGAPRSLCATAKAMGGYGHFRETVLGLEPSPSDGLRMAREAGLEVLDAPGEEAARRAIERADVVIVHWWNNPPIWRFLRSEHPPMRLVLYVHVAGDRLPSVVTRELVDFVDFGIGCCRYTLVSTPLNEVPRKTAAVYAAPDFDRIGDLQRPARDTFTVGYIGAVDFKKMHPDYVHLCAAVRVPAARFVAYGHGRAAATIRRQAKRLGIGDRLDVRGYVENIGPVLQSFDVFGYPLGAAPGAELVVQEALYSGLPVVAFPLGGLNDLVIDGFNGFLVRDRREYCGALERLHGDAAERRRLSANARGFASQMFGGAHSARRLAEILEGVAAHPKHKRRWPHAGYPLPERPPRSAAGLYVETLGHLGGDFHDSLVAEDSARRREAEKRIMALPPSALNSLRDHSDHFPGDPHLHFWHALAAFGGGDRAAAEAALGRALETGLPRQRGAPYRELFRRPPAAMLHSPGNPHAPG